MPNLRDRFPEQTGGLRDRFPKKTGGLRDRFPEQKTFSTDGTEFNVERSNGTTILSEDTPNDYKYVYSNPEQRERWKEQGPITWTEAAIRKDKVELVPFVNAMTVIDDIQTYNAVKRLQGDDYVVGDNTDDSAKQSDQDVVSAYMLKVEEEQYRGYHWGAKVYNGATGLLPMMVEFGLTAGLYTGGKVAAQTAIKKVLKEGTESLIGKAVMKTVPMVAGAAAQSSVMANRYYPKYKENQILANTAVTDKGIGILKEAEESPAKSFVKAYGDTLIEVYSEHLGGEVFRPVAKAGLNKIAPKARKAIVDFMDKLPAKTRVTGLLRKGGMNNVVEELGEEEVGRWLRASFNVEGQEGNILQRIAEQFPSMEDRLVEVGVFSIPGAVSGTSRAIGSRMRKRGATSEEVDAVDSSMSELEKDEWLENDTTAREQVLSDIDITQELTEEQEATIDEAFDEIVPQGLKEKSGQPWQTTQKEFIEAKPLPQKGVFKDGTDIQSPTGRNVSAVKLDDGTVYYDTEAIVHADLIDSLDIPTERIVEGGFIVDGKYKEGGADAARIGRQGLAKRKVEHIRSVRDAFDRGEKIPREVLKDYPELLKEAQPKDIVAEINYKEKLEAINANKISQTLPIKEELTPDYIAKQYDVSIISKESEGGAWHGRGEISIPKDKTLGKNKVADWTKKDSADMESINEYPQDVRTTIHEVAHSLLSKNPEKSQLVYKDMRKLGIPDDVLFESTADTIGGYILEPKSITNKKIKSIMDKYYSEDILNRTKLDKTLPIKASIAKRYKEAEVKLNKLKAEKAELKDVINAQKDMLSLAEEMRKPFLRRIAPDTATKEWTDQLPTKFKSKAGESLDELAMLHTEGDMNDMVAEILSLDDAVSSARNELGLSRESVKVLAEKTVKKTEIKDVADTIQDFKAGVRTGEVSSKESIKAYQKTFVSLVKNSNLEAKDKAKFLNAITEANTVDKLSKAIRSFEERAGKLIAQQQKRTFKEKIKTVLSSLVSIKKDAKPKYAYESFKHFVELKRINGLTIEEANRELFDIGVDFVPQTEAERMLISFLSLKAYGDKATPELHAQVYGDLLAIKSYGKQAQDEENFLKRMERAERVEELKEIDDKNAKANKKKFITKLGTFYAQGVGNEESIINALFNAEVAKMYSLKMEESAMNRAIQSKKEEIDREMERIYKVGNSTKIVTDMMADDGYTMIGKNVKFEMNKLDIINVYNSIKNEHTRTVYENQFGKDQIADLLRPSNLSVQDRAFGDYLMEEVQGYREVLNKASIKKFGRDIGFVEKYWPRASENEANLFNEYIGQSNIPGATKARTGNTHIIPIKQNAYLVAIKHITQAEHSDKMSEKYETVKRLFSNPEIKNRIENKYGESVYNGLIKNIDNLSLNGLSRDVEYGVGKINFIFNNWVVSKIAWNPTSIARQVGSFTNYAQHMNMADWVIGTTKALATPKATFDYMWNNSPYLRARFKRGYTEASERAIKDAARIGAKFETFTNLMTLGTRLTDSGAQIYGGRALVKELEKTMSTEAAFKEFERISIDEQQSALKSSRSAWQNNPNLRWFFPFKNTLGQYTRLQADAIYKYLHGDIGLGQMAKVLFLIGVVQPTLYALTGNAIIEGWKALGDDDEDIEDKVEKSGLNVATNIATQPFKYFPLLGSFSEAGFRRLTGQATWKLFSEPVLQDVELAWQKSKKKEITPLDIMVITSMLSEMAIPNPSGTALRYYNYLAPEKKKKKW